MPVSKVCPGCRRVFKARRGDVRCEDCAADVAHERGQTRSAAVANGEPWRAIYKIGAWYNARRLTLARDDWSCRGSWNGRRCATPHRLQVHHTTPLRDLWRAAGSDFDLFVRLATDVSKLVSLCPRCHARAEADQRRA